MEKRMIDDFLSYVQDTFGYKLRPVEAKGRDVFFDLFGYTLLRDGRRIDEGEYTSVIDDVLISLPDLPEPVYSFDYGPAA